jgi:hypothetical protein
MAPHNVVFSSRQKIELKHVLISLDLEIFAVCIAKTMNTFDVQNKRGRTSGIMLS